LVRLFKERPYGWILLFYPFHPLWYFLIQQSAATPRNVHSILDDMILFNEWFALAYVFWYVFMIGGLLLLLLWAERRIFLRTIALLYAGIAICLITQAACHTAIDYRPAAESLTGNPFAIWVVKLIYGFDKPYNVFPSIHCYGSLALMMGFWHTRMPCKWLLRIVISVMAFTICFSTLYIKQHSSLDFIAAMGITAVLYPLLFIPKWQMFEKDGLSAVSMRGKVFISAVFLAGFTLVISTIILLTGGFAAF